MKGTYFGELLNKEVYSSEPFFEASLSSRIFVRNNGLKLISYD